MLVSTSFILVSGNFSESNGESIFNKKNPTAWGGNDADNIWNKVSTVEELQNMKSDKKYYLTNDIDMSYIFYEQSFNIKIEIDVGENNVIVSLLLDTEDVPISMYVSSAVIFLNGMIRYIVDGKASATFDYDGQITEYTISAKGTATNIDSTYDADFIIADTGSETDIEDAFLPSKGNFEPIGSPESPFKGTLNGNGHRIIGLRTTSYESSGNVYSGLFAYTDGATIMNLGMEGGSTILITSVLSSSINAYAGRFVGYANNTVTITDSYNTGKIIMTASAEDTNAYIGGLIGYATDADVKNIYSTGKLTVGESEGYKGGLIGYIANIGDSKVESSYALENMGATELIGNDDQGQALDEHSGLRSTDKMKSGDEEDTYVGWDFVKTWSIDQGKSINEGYPYLESKRWKNFIIDEGGSYDPTSAGGTWIPISTYEELKSMSSGNNYYLTNNIYLNSINAEDAFEITLEVVRTNNTVRISLMHNETILDLTKGLISLNEEIITIEGNVAEGYFDIDESVKEFVICAGGTLTDVEEGKDASFAIAKRFLVSDETQYIFALQSKGNFEPIGSIDSPFRGILDGNGYTISGLRTTSYKISENSISGLFAYTGEATIRNLGLEEGSCIAILQGVNEYIYAYAGGLIGCVWVSGSNTTLTNSYNTGEISTIADCNQAIAASGGLVGRAIGIMQMTNDYNTGHIFSLSSSYNYLENAYAGGLIGDMNSGEITIKDSYNAGKIIAAGSPNLTNRYGNKFSGGLAGYGNITTINSYNIGDITAISSSNGSSIAYAGGLTGRGNITTINSYNIGDITAISSSNETSIIFIGGLAGHAYNAKITNSSNIGKITSFLSSGKPEEMKSYTKSGGLAGYTSNIEITGSYNKGDVTVESNDVISYAGGLIGYAINGISVSNSYNIGNIKAIFEEHIPYVGGLSGYVGSAQITNSYNVGKTEALSDISEGGYKGGLIGYVLNISNSKVESSYALENMGATELIGNDDQGQALDEHSGLRSTEKMKSADGEDTYVDWDFENIWTIDITGAINDGYPYLELMPDNFDKVKINISTGTGIGTIEIEINSTTTHVGTGSITVTVNKGDDIVVRVFSKESYSIYHMFVNGESITGALGQSSYDYQFYAMEDTEITLGFRSPMYYVKVETEDNFTLTITPCDAVGVKNLFGTFDFFFEIEEEGYRATDLKYNVYEVTATLNVNTVAVSQVKAASIVYLSIDNMYAVTITSTAGGMTDPSGEHMVEYGSSFSISLTPYYGYVLTDVLVDGKSMNNSVISGRISLSNITTDMKVHAIYSQLGEDDILYYLHVYAVGGGRAYSSGYHTAGSTVTIYAEADKGHVFTHWSDGNTSAVRTVVVNGDMTISAHFERSDNEMGPSITLSGGHLIMIIVAILILLGSIWLLWFIAKRRKKDEEEENP